MAGPVRDRWAEWLLRRRHGGDPEQREATMGFLVTIRDRVLHNAALSGGGIRRDAIAYLGPSSRERSTV